MSSRRDDRAHKAEKETSIPPKFKSRKDRRFTLPVTVVILAVVIYLVHPSLSATYNYLYGPPPQAVSHSYQGNDGFAEDDDDFGYDLCGGTGTPPEYTSDIWGSSIQAQRDEFHNRGEAYVPKYTYEDYRLPPPKPVKRYDLEYDKVACWQDDGVWIKKLSPVEMHALGVNRFEDTERATDQAEEDDFCAQLRLHGASFWTLPIKWPEWYIWCSTVECVEPAKKTSFEAGFPSTGGVWLLNATSNVAEVETPPFTENVALKNVLTMDERCHVLRDLGGVFCQDVKACPEMDRLLAA